MIGNRNESPFLLKVLLYRLKPTVHSAFLTRVSRGKRLATGWQAGVAACDRTPHQYTAVYILHTSVGLCIKINTMTHDKADKSFNKIKL